MINAMVAGEYVWGPLTIEKAIEKIMGYNVTETQLIKH
jgi:hypothetical protein